MATTSKDSAGALGQEPPAGDAHPHEVSGVHGHAGYPTQADLDTRLAAARGQSAPVVEPALPFPDPAQQ